MNLAEAVVRIKLPVDVLEALKVEAEADGIPVPMLARRAIVKAYRSLGGDDRNPTSLPVKMEPPARPPSGVAHPAPAAADLEEAGA